MQQNKTSRSPEGWRNDVKHLGIHQRSLCGSWKYGCRDCTHWYHLSVSSVLNHYTKSVSSGQSLLQSPNGITLYQQRSTFQVVLDIKSLIGLLTYDTKAGPLSLDRITAVITIERRHDREEAEKCLHTVEEEQSLKGWDYQRAKVWRGTKILALNCHENMCQSTERGTFTWNGFELGFFSWALRKKHKRSGHSRVLMDIWGNAKDKL